MDILSNIPLVGIAIGVFLLFIILPDRNYYVQNKLAKTFLVVIILLNIYEQTDSLFVYNKLSLLQETSYLFYHLHGFLFFMFINALLKNNKFIKKSVILMGSYTIIRAIVIIILDETINWENYEETLTEIYMIWLDAYISIILNICFLVWSYKILHKMKFAVNLTNNELQNVTWLKRLLVLSIIIYIAIVQHNIVSDMKSMDGLKQAKIESVFTNLLFFIIAIFAIKFPAFSIFGDFKEDTSPEAKKYANSKLQKNDSLEIWNNIQRIISNNKAFLNQEYRLNDLAEKCNYSIHVVSQVINKNAGCSFSDYLNKHRIVEAKKMLISDKSEQFTILAIAYEVGFNSKTAFYTAFKKELGITPTEYRKQNLNT